MDTSGTLVWFNQIGVGSWRDDIDPHHNFGNSIQSIGDTIYISGHFLGKIDFGARVLNSQGAHDLFYAKYLKNGSFIDAGQYLVKGWSSANDMAIDEFGNITIAGYSFENNTSSNETQFMLIGRIDSLDNSDLTATNNYTKETTIVYPNPSNSILHIKSSENQIRGIQIFDSHGRIIQSSKHADREIHIDVSRFIEGIYFIIVYGYDSIEILRFIKTD